MKANGPIKRVERIGGQTLILGDCLSVMPLLGKFDAVLTDPPYGIGASKSNFLNHKHKSNKWKNPKPKEYKYGEWDNKVADISWFDLDRPCIIWGGNYFNLPPTSCWLVWNKLGSAAFADAELAWTNLDKAVRSIDYLWAGFQKQRPEERFHPTQKPLAVMEWCIKHLPDTAQTILDPFAGSGTTAVACERLGRQCTAIELDADYFEIMCKRVDEATRQPDLFVNPPAPKPTQEGFL